MDRPFLYFWSAMLFVAVVAMFGRALQASDAWYASTAANWAQAIGGVGAVFAAIWTVAEQGRREQRRRATEREEALELARELVGSGEYRLTALVNSACSEAPSIGAVSPIETINLQSAADALARIPIQLLLPPHNARASAIAENRLRIAADILRRASADILKMEDSPERADALRQLGFALMSHLIPLREAKSLIDDGRRSASTI